MNEAIMEVLNSGNYENNEDIAKAIQTALATKVIPKDKFNDQSKRLQNIEAEKGNLQSSYDDLQSRYDELRKQNMTAEERNKEEIEQLRKDRESVARQLSEIAIEKVLAKNGVSADTYGDDEYKNLVDDLIADNVENSKKKAENFVKILNKQKDFVEKETTSKLLKNTPSPVTGEGNDKPITKEDFDKMTYSQMIKLQAENPELFNEFMNE